MFSFIVNPNNEGTIIDFVRVELTGFNPIEIGTDQIGPSVAGQKITFTDLTSLDNLSANVLWHTTSMVVGGRWTTNLFTFNESELYVEETGPSTLLQIRTGTGAHSSGPALQESLTRIPHSRKSLGPRL